MEQQEIEAIVEQGGTQLSAALAAFGVGLIVFAVIWYVLQIIAYWKIFTKANRPGWHSIIPFLNTWEEFDLSWCKQAAWAVIVLALVNGYFVANVDTSGSTLLKVIAAIISCAYGVCKIEGNYKLGKAFGKGTGFCIGLILLAPVFKLILGFGDARYVGRNGEPGK